MPDVQLDTGNSTPKLLFEVKAGHRTNGIVLKRNQLKEFAGLSNCSFALAFHRSADLVNRWKSGKDEKRTIRRELAQDYSSIFIVPPHVLSSFYKAHKHRERPLPRSGGEEYYVTLLESHVRDFFDAYDGKLERQSTGRIHVISNDLVLGEDHSQAPYIFQKK